MPFQAFLSRLNAFPKHFELPCNKINKIALPNLLLWNNICVICVDLIIINRSTVFVFCTQE